MEERYTELYEKLTQLQWLLHRNHMMRHAEHGPFADASRGQGRVLAMLKLQPEISTKDLSYLLGIRVASLNELLGKLERNGYVTRVPAESDKRVMLIRLTDKGAQQQPSGPDYSGIFDCLNEQEQQAFGEYLDRVIAALEERVGAEPNEAELKRWQQAARSRMGDERFERMMAMRGGPHRGEPHRGGMHHDGRCFQGDPRQGNPHWGDPRGPAPRGMPCAERFAPAYDGPLPGEQPPYADSTDADEQG